MARSSLASIGASSSGSWASHKRGAATVVEKRSNVVDEWVTIHETARLNLPMRGMTCAVCIATLKRGLAHDPGIYKASVNLAAERSTLTYDPEQAGVEEIASHMERSGGGRMVEFLQANWPWLLLGIVVLWFFSRGGMGGMGCGRRHR